MRKNRTIDPKPYGIIRCRRFVDVESVVNNIVVKEVREESFIPNDNFKEFRSSDFLIENIIAAGATDMLHPSPQFGNTDIDKSIEKISSQLESIDNNLNN